MVRSEADSYPRLMHFDRQAIGDEESYNLGEGLVGSEFLGLRLQGSGGEVDGFGVLVSG